MTEEKKENRVKDDKKKQELKELLLQGEISILLDNYDDIFSDFDPRSFSQRALSDDFLNEAKKAAREKKGILQLTFLIPSSQRRTEFETVIKKRLRDHFKKHAELLEKEDKEAYKKSILIVLAGFSCTIAASFISYYDFKSFLFYFLIAVLEPAGWFSLWTGLDQLFFTAKRRKPELDFYQRMTKCEMIFLAY